MGFCFLLSGHRKPDKVWERVAVRRLWDWGWGGGPPSRAQKQEWGQGPQNGSADALAGAQDLPTEGKAGEALERGWGHRLTGEATNPGDCSQDSHAGGLDAAGWKMECGAGQPCSHCHCF